MVTFPITLKQPCIEYESTFQHSKLEQVKLTQSYTDGTLMTKKCPIFTGEEGIERLLYVEERFRKIAKQLEFTTGPELFNNFEEVLTDNAEEKWENVVSNIAEADCDEACFNEAMEAYYLKYCDEDSKDTLFDYLQAFRQPKKVTPQDHSERVGTLVRYANKLPGLSPAMQPDK
eukprot:1463699-Ditylum_brightwellii.AAC.1